MVNKCKEISKTYNIDFIEIGTDENHVHLLIQLEPTRNISEIVRITKSITAREIFAVNPEVKEKLWGGEFWADGYWAVTVSRTGTEDIIRDYVKNQGYGKYELLLRREFEPEF
jgi:REP element-mobilizing transposase RayT